MADASPSHPTKLDRVVAVLKHSGVVRSKDLVASGIHRQYIRVALERGVLKQIGRGLYAAPDWDECKCPIILACKRYSSAVLCLESALHFHGLIPESPSRPWIAIDRKAWKPRTSIPVRFVRFSGEALTQGLVNVRLNGVPIRVYSPMKTIADCFKYRNKIGLRIAVAALEAAVEHNKYNRQKLLRFAEICRVKKLVTSYADEIDRTLAFRRKEDIASTSPVWDPGLLRQQVWAEPLVQVARRYGVSDVALGKHCKRLNISLPGRGYWARKRARIAAGARRSP